MENWVIATKFIIILYCIIRYVSGDFEDIPVTLLSVLFYVILSVLCYLPRKRMVKCVILSMTALDVLLSSLLINPFFTFLLPVSVLELVSVWTSRKYIWAVSAVITAFFCRFFLLPEFVLISSLTLLILILAGNTYNSLDALKKEIEMLNDMNECLSGRINSGTEYENQVKYLTQLEERNDLAQKIHDKVGHTIAGSLIQLEAAALIMDKDGEKARDILNKVINHLKDGMESIRSTLRNIKPASEQLGINRLKVLLDQFSMNNSIKTELIYGGSLDNISHSQWSIIIDNVKEALTNALKYSKATLIKVDIEVMNKLVKAEVMDNGQGTCQFKKGLGISGMEERTENLGGKLIIDGSRGFSIIMLLPVESTGEGDKPYLRVT